MEKKSAEFTEQSPLLSSGRPPLYTYALAACAALNSVNLGYDMGVNSGVSVLVEQQWKLTAWQVGFYMGSLSFIAAFGALITAGIADRLGRCMTFAVSQVSFIIGVAMSAAAPNYWWLMAGRLFLGIGIGVGQAIDPLYISEVSPADYRGSLTTWSEFAINLGILLGFTSNAMLVGLGENVAWRVMLAVGLILPVVLLFLSLCVMPESPRWLMMRSRNAEAEHVLMRTHPPGTDLQPVLDNLRKQVDDSQQECSWQDLFAAFRVPGPTRRQLMVGIGIALAQQANGSDSLVQFSPRIFEGAGAETTHQQFLLTIFMGVVKTIFIAIAAFLLDNAGRRPLLLYSNVAMALCHLLLSTSLSMGWAMLSSGAVMMFVAAFSLGMGPICWLLASEVFPLQYRGRAMSSAVFANRMMSGLVATAFLPMSNELSLPGYFMFFAAVTATITVIIGFTVPETKRLTLEQMSTTFI